MDKLEEAAAARVTRLKAWIKKHRNKLLGPDGDVAPSKVASETEKKTSYWSDVLRGEKPFAASAARMAEAKLGIPHLHLEGAGWPFQDVDIERWEKLSERQKAVVEHLFNETLDKIEAKAAPNTKPAAA